MKRTSTLLILGILIVFVMGSYTGYLYWKQSSTAEGLKRVEANLAEYQNKMLQFESKEILEAINAKKTLSDLEDDMIEWSKVIKKIRKTIPKEDGMAIVEVLSYSGSASNEISMNVKTYPDRDKPYFDIADLIRAFDESTSFEGGFVPSISSGIDEEGNEILTFLFGAEFVEEDPFELLESGDVEEEVTDEDEAVLR
jgi:hypothetical protein